MVTPHPIPYQGSKRNLAGRILSYMPAGVRLVEPFAGSAAITLAAAARNAFQRYLIGDLLQPLAGIWRQVLRAPHELAEEYERLWLSQRGDPRGFYDQVRDRFNQTQEPALLLYLLARCVKASVRFNRQGEFNQSPDNRRLGMRPSVMKREILAAHALLKGSTEVVHGDFRDTLSDASGDDVVYLDPPYQGISGGRDSRYVSGLTLHSLAEELDRMNSLGIPYVLSYDGMCGERRYGDELPPGLGLRRVLLTAGRSTQSTLAGRSEVTVESLYISPAAQDRLLSLSPVLRPSRQMALPP